MRLRVVPYRGDDPSTEAVVNVFDALHKRLLRRWWRRLFSGQPSVALEIHCHREAWLSLTCPVGMQPVMEAALRSAYPNCRLQDEPTTLGSPPYVLRLKKHSPFIKRAKLIDPFDRDRVPTVNRLITTMAACRAPAFVQIALTPTPALFEGHSKRSYKRHEHHLSRQRKLRLPPLDRSMVEDEELKGGLDVQHQPLFFVDLRLVGPNRAVCERIASELRAESAENRLVERGTSVRHGWFGMYTRRVSRGEGNPLPSIRKGVFASTELANVWQMPSVDYSTVPFARNPLPLAPAPPTIFRPLEGTGTLRDASGPVSIHPSLRRQNTAVPGTVEQGKSSYLVATVAEDLRRERCAVIVLDPKGDAAEAAVSVVPTDRTCTLLDFSHPTCGFNPLAVDAPADTIADYVVSALKNLFSDGDIRASSDRYLRNAIIAVLAYDRHSTLWDAARLLSVGEEGYAYRSRVAGALRTQPEFKEISEFFTGELSAQLADARGTTTAKLDAPVNKLARLLNSPSIKRVLLNDSLRVSFDEVIANEEVLVVKGALGVMGAGNTSVLMQLLTGMLDAALARRQDGVDGRAADCRGSEGGRGAACAQQRLCRDNGAEALGGPGDCGLLADRLAMGRSRHARPVGRAVCPSRLFRHRIGRGRTRRCKPDDGRVLRHRSSRDSQPVDAGAPRCAPSFAPTLCDRKLGNGGRPPGPVHRPNSPAACGRATLGFSYGTTSRARRTLCTGPQPAALGARWARAGQARGIPGSSGGRYLRAGGSACP